MHEAVQVWGVVTAATAKTLHIVEQMLQTRQVIACTLGGWLVWENRKRTLSGFTGPNMVRGPRMGLGIKLQSAKGPLHKKDTSSTLGNNE
jgi:hypothetical protein